MAAFVNEEQWLVDGNPLSTWAYNIESIGGRQSVPVRGGTNALVPFRPGEVWKPKIARPHTLSLGMWIRSSDQEGITPKTAVGRRAQFNENLRALKQLFYNTERPLTLSRGIRFLTGIEFFTTQVECYSNLEPTMVGPNFGRMVIELNMLSPYWEKGSSTQTIPNGLIGGIVNNPGDDRTIKILLNVRPTGVINPGSVSITNHSYSPPIKVGIPTPATGVVSSLDVENFFYSRGGDMTVNWQSTLNYTGSSFWMELKKGENRISIDSRFGQGNFNPLVLDIFYIPVYL
jgi:hypothetical protein